MNTLRSVLYEWDDSATASDDDFRPSYIATLRVRAGARDGAIEDVLLD